MVDSQTTLQEPVIPCEMVVGTIFKKGVKVSTVQAKIDSMMKLQLFLTKDMSDSQLMRVIIDSAKWSKENGI